MSIGPFSTSWWGRAGYRRSEAQSLAAADVAISLVDNAQETFGLAVAEAMAAGLPLVVSDWSGYRDLVRNGIDGYLIPSAWATSAPHVSVSLGWQQFTGMQSFPAVAGALAQLVQIDLEVLKWRCSPCSANPSWPDRWVLRQAGSKFVRT